MLGVEEEVRAVEPRADDLVPLRVLLEEDGDAAG
jgi:hypothetical protein